MELTNMCRNCVKASTRTKVKTIVPYRANVENMATKVNGTLEKKGAITK